MDRAVRCRQAAREAVADVEPDSLHDLIADRLDGASMAPGVLTLESASQLDTEAPLEDIVSRAAGVQLIYEGLRLTRRLAHEEPWNGDRADTDGGLDTDRSPDDGDPPFDGPLTTESDSVPTDVPATGDLDILAADILVARGFYLLARTDAADKAVRTVQSFGRDQTRRQSAADPAAIDANLERDVLELAVLTGAAAVDSTPTSALLTAANDLADAIGTEFPSAQVCLESFGTAHAGRTADDAETGTPPGDRIRTDRATSTSDP